ncbi:MAG: flagellar assembly peptidoglycan hydrolase FlgJ [Woeseiaceae bacterium]|nr:flagellar assembly peptidoglycan hydrolase FlgJ [Woeseiaceae bacterium]
MTATITDFSQFTGLRAAANQNDPAALREVAGQFEALFLQSLLKNMREASLGDPVFGNSDQQEMYQGMLDQQLSLEMSSGNGIGIADMLVRQLGGADPQGELRPERDFAISNRVRPQSVTPAGQQATWPDARTFARDIWPHAQRAARQLQVAPEAIVAQAALETGWGAHVMPGEDGGNSFNLFGIKAGRGWQGAQVSRQTLEFDNGVPRPQRAQFRTYADVAATFDDYTRFLTENPRYSGVIGHGDDVEGFASALQASGYATDPDYAAKLTRVLDSPTMRAAIGDLKNSAGQPITAQLSSRVF